MLNDYRLFFQSIEHYALLLLKSHGIIQFANKAASAICGYSEAELLHRSFKQLYTEEDQRLKRDELELFTAQEANAFEAEYWRQKKDGSRYWAHTDISAVYNEQNQLEGYTVLIKDISEKKKNELELREKEERYRLMIEGVTEYGIFMLDTEGNIVTWNEGAKRITGYPSYEIIGKNFSVFYIAEDRQSHKPERELEIAIATGKYEEEGWRVRKDGKLFWSGVTITTLYNEDNQFVGFSKVTRDLTERKEEEEKLRQSEERFRELVQQVKDYGIFMLDEKGRIISWNEGAKRINGYEAEEIIGKYFSIFYTEEDKINGKPANELKIAQATGKYEEEGWRVRKNGMLFWTNVVITALFNRHGKLIGYSKVTRDLTERKESERALKESSDRYRLLADELKITNTELARTNKELEQFTSIVSHDLQEPLRTIKSFLVLIDKKLPQNSSPELRSYIQKATYAGNRMKELILNLLQYAQLSKDDISVEAISVTTLLGEALQNIKDRMDATGATITVENDIAYVYGHKVQLVQLLQNLLANALKFSQPGRPPRIHIKITRRESDILFSITDNGIGIASENKNKIFEIFRRLHVENTYPGNGIGLSICKKIVDRHNGRIWPESKLGEGSTFHFTIKADKAIKENILISPENE